MTYKIRIDKFHFSSIFYGMQGIQGTCEGSFMHINKLLQDSDCGQQSVQFSIATCQWNPMHPFFGWTTT